jgi:hypothetical protein
LNALSALGFFASFFLLSSLSGQLNTLSHNLFLVLVILSGRMNWRGWSSNLLRKRPIVVWLRKSGIGGSARRHPIRLVLTPWRAMR